VSRFRGEWLAQAVVESVLVVVSILLALAVDNWREERGFAQLADQSLGIFEREIRQNQARLEDANPFHSGIRDLLGQAIDQGGASMDLRGIMEGVETPVILNTAWQTALATGALTHMDVETVSALSLTYSIQDRFIATSGRHRPRLTNLDDLDRAALHEGLHTAFDYMTTLTRGEAELLTVYGEALALIQDRRFRNAAGDEAKPDPRDRAHP
jgi:hypothetical protein